MKYLILLACISVHLSVIAQSKILLGTWVGNMQGNQGAYTFRLTLQDPHTFASTQDFTNTDNYHNIYAVATHDRNQNQKTFRLKGRVFPDQSIYLYEIAEDLKDQDPEDVEFNRLEFELKILDGMPVLDGHWQEYKTIRKFIKGRLFLRKQNLGS